MLGYLDPATGSSIAAVVASGAVGVGVAMKVVRQRVAGKFGRKTAPAEVVDESRDASA